jgi:hypothetical protein
MKIIHIFAYCPLAVEKGQPGVLTLHRGASKRKTVKGSGWGLGGYLLFENGFRLWQSMSVCFLTLLSSFLQRISVSVF